LRLYFNERGYAKVELGLVKGKRKVDRRREIMEREIQREIDRTLRKRR
jgi:SsrA-binding protein